MLLGGGCVCLLAGFVWHGWANVLWPVAFALSLLGVGGDLRRALPERRLVLVVAGVTVMLISAAIHHFLAHGTLRLMTDGVLAISILVILLAIAPYLWTPAANQRA